MARLDTIRSPIDAAIREINGDPPTIVGLKVTPEELPYGGGNVDVYAVVLDATSIKVNGREVILPATFTVEQTTTFVMEVEGPGGVAQDSIAVEVAPPPPGTVEVFDQTLNLSAVVCLSVQYSSSRYERYQRHREFVLTAINEEFKRTDIAAGGGTSQGFSAPSYALHVSTDPNQRGPVRATYTRVGTERVGRFVGAFGDEPDGLIFLTIAPSAPTTESYPRCVATLDRAGRAKDDKRIGFQRGSHEWIGHSGALSKHQIAVASTSLLGHTAPPLVPTPATPFNTPLPPTALFHIHLTAPWYGAVPRRPLKTKRGNWVTEGRQPYAYGDVITSGHSVNQPLLDGPRGVGTTQMITSVQSGRNGKWYVCDPWAFYRIDSDGHKTTLLGLRQRHGTYWPDATIADCEIVGNWDPSIPQLQRFPWECWGFKFWKRSLLLDEAAAPIGGEQPHLLPGPRGFLSDRHGFVLSAQFNARVRETPANVTRMFAASDPWGLDELDDVIYVAERGLNRISKWSAFNGSPQGVLIQGPALGAVGTDRVWRGSDVSVTRQHPCIAPEGLAIQDGWVYYGSLAQREVRRVSLSTGQIEVCCRPKTDNNTNYFYIWLSDGTFGPRGTIFVTTWSVLNNGWAFAFVPKPGVATDGTPLTHSQGWAWKPEEDTSYGAAGAIGNGMMLCGAAKHGLDLFRKREATDPPIPTATQKAAIARGHLIFNGEHALVHGWRGYGWLNIPLPWGESADLDAYLVAQGHIKP